ncbi:MULTISPECIES: ASKHA domain-containing protein [unclassified Candidatus Frackibacter]|uniref:ASKHA domain-containing protein n=1 Tax=unclassified Candidatus Frackibacter TaxID=2648818 RepID=UPI000880AEF6|nr:MULTISPECIES: ASKHA domain-containing protein [unclassified Candidatus Frackibacter]SDC70143.1 Uncharacterized 2Fe-2 and 4Fe-4S clusters-containing protein, contains DUF4445 domain [Candidatus Frackibacter sp. WG11]SEM85336.1 Uncharacterized 2Fe-2 and 4Fe-4S clusters-containing protein, contains DUF4445 domain [Candidatus Frackibacter sp. WG12]SFL94535.1 Uncharacterized 2Fe-2 and 4Fe-4S clusters-containing protein, contains DUF4445 domain [Candidatus Frackibacter sp. WG13]
MVEVRVQTSEEELVLEAEIGENLLDFLRKHNIETDAICGGNGICGKCKVKVKGEVSEISLKERDLLSELELESGIRLACLTEIQGEVEVELISDGRATLRILDEGDEDDLNLEPTIKKDYLELQEPTLEDQASDWTRIIKSIGEELEVDLELLKELPDILRDANYKVTIVRQGKKVINIEKDDTTDVVYGLAIDIGTTTVVGYLLDLVTGVQVGKVAMANRQSDYGSDVISRVNHTLEKESGTKDLQDRIIEVINQIIDQLIDKYEVSRERIYELVFVGNTVMSHLLLGLKTEHVAKAPYVAVINEPQSISADELGIKLNASVTYLPNVASYVGSDIVAGLLTNRIDQSDDFKLLVDLGTNSEIVLGNKEKMMACAAAAGPAFEGAGLEFGMNGVQGAIEEIRITDRIEVSVIGNQKAKGICGSGIISLLAELLKAGIMDKSGKLLSPDEIDNSVVPEIKERIIEGDKGRKLILVKAEEAAGEESVTISQKDIRAIQLAQGAIRAGIKILMDELGIGIEEIGEVLIAGGFGNYIQPQDAVTVGVLPTSSKLEIRGIGNAAGSGAKAALLSQTKRKESKQIAKQVEYLELSGRQDFQNEFMSAMTFEKFEQR